MHNKPLESFKDQRLYSSEPETRTVPLEQKPPRTPYAVKTSSFKYEHKDGAKPFTYYDHTESSWMVKFDAIKVISFRWDGFETLEHLIGYCHRVFERPFKASQKQLLSLPALALDGEVVSNGVFISSVFAQLGASNIDACSFFGIDQFTYSELDIDFDQTRNLFNVNRPPNSKKFFDYLEIADSGHELITLYHGTWRTNVPRILMHGLSASRRGAIGSGVYLGLKDKAFTFSTRPRNLRGYFNYEKDTETNRVIFECDVILRDVEKLTAVNYGAGHDGRDGYCSAFRRPEWCIREPFRVLIKRIHLVH